MTTVSRMQWKPAKKNYPPSFLTQNQSYYPNQNQANPSANEYRPEPMDISSGYSKFPSQNELNFQNVDTAENHFENPFEQENTFV